MYKTIVRFKIKIIVTNTNFGIIVALKRAVIQVWRSELVKAEEAGVAAAAVFSYQPLDGVVTAKFHASGVRQGVETAEQAEVDCFFQPLLENSVHVREQVAVKTLGIIEDRIHFSIIVETHVSVKVHHGRQVLQHNHCFKVQVDYFSAVVVNHVSAGSGQSRKQCDLRRRNNAVYFLKQEQWQFRQGIRTGSSVHSALTSMIHRVRTDGIVKSHHKHSVGTEAGQFSVGVGSLLAAARISGFGGWGPSWHSNILDFFHSGTKLKVGGSRGLEIRNMTVAENSDPAFRVDGLFLQSLHRGDARGASTSLFIHPNVLRCAEFAVTKSTAVVIKLDGMISRINWRHIHHTEMALAGSPSVDGCQEAGEIRRQLPVGRHDGE